MAYYDFSPIRRRLVSLQAAYEGALGSDQRRLLSAEISRVQADLDKAGQLANVSIFDNETARLTELQQLEEKYGFRPYRRVY